VLHVKVPVGLVSNNTGIAVGFKSYILPRKLEDIENYLNGKAKRAKPYFMNFTGKIIEHPEFPDSWLISGDYHVESKRNKHAITITEIPVTEKYESLVNKINTFLEKKNISSIKISNESQIKVKITLETKDAKDFASLKAFIDKILTVKVSENLGFVKDGMLLQYSKFEDYLDDFLLWKKQLLVKKLSFDLDKAGFNLQFLNIKLSFLEYMYETQRPTLEKINAFLTGINEEVTAKLKQIPAYKINAEEIARIRDEEIIAAQELEKELSKSLKACDKDLYEYIKSHKSKANLVETN